MNADDDADPVTPLAGPEGENPAERKRRRKIENREDAESEKPLSAPTVYQIIARQGIEEMERPLKSLWWSGVAAGLGISISLFAMAALRVTLEGVPGALAIEKLGYCLGFLVVVLSRLQLFTENTITPILPALGRRDRTMLWLVMRLWSVVFAANMLGTFLSALLPYLFPIGSPELMRAMLEISAHFGERSLSGVFFSAIPAGFMIAAMVWMVPSSKGFEFWTISAMTFAVAITDTSHVVVGSAELFTALLHGEIGPLDTFSRLALAGAGNVIGGTGLFAVLAYAQVSEEI